MAEEKDTAQRENGRMAVQKTYKIFIGGKFPRSESGRYYAVKDAAGNFLANACHCSRKDVRDAVSAARAAFGGWADRAPFNRGQILYRMAEMLEGRRDQFISELKSCGSSASAAAKEVDACIDRMVYYAGWCDKLQQVFSSVNPVSSSHFNFSVQEAMGVVGIIAPEQPALLGLVSVLLPVIAGGNTAVVVASTINPLPAVSLAEVLNTSDLPGGVVNILTGTEKEMLKTLASHMDVNGICYARPAGEFSRLAETEAVSNVKRIHLRDEDWHREEAQGPYQMLDFQEVKTTWHPIQSIGGAKAGY